MIIEKKVYYQELYDCYQKLLTVKQRSMFEYYFTEDLTIIEISDILKISKIAVYNNIQRTLTKLEHYEHVIGHNELKKKYDELIIDQKKGE